MIQNSDISVLEARMSHVASFYEKFCLLGFNFSSRMLFGISHPMI